MNRFHAQFRAQIDGNTLSGHASVFGQYAEMPGHLECIDPGAFDEVLSSSDTDCRALINHDPMLLLGRQSAGTLRLKVDDLGLYFECDLPDTSYANDLRTLVARGDITGCSFGWVPGADAWSTLNGRQLRTHTNVKELVDVSAVTWPAYQGTDVALRSIDFGRESLRSQMIRLRHSVRANTRKG